MVFALIALMVVFTLFAIYVLIVGFRMSKVYGDLEAIHQEFKLYRKKLFRSVRPVFYSSEEDYQNAVTQAKNDMEISRQKEKEISRNKVIWLAPFSKNTEKFLSADIKDYLNVVRAFKQRDDLELD